MEYILISNKSTLEEYNRYYFRKYPNRKKKPIDTPIQPSLNVWTVKQRLSMNNLKQNWKEYTEWLVKNQGYKDLQIEHCEIACEIYMPTLRRADTDNFTPKFVMDGLVSSGMLIDDDYKHCNPLRITLGYDKNNPTMIIKVLEK